MYDTNTQYGGNTTDDIFYNMTTAKMPFMICNLDLGVCKQVYCLLSRNLVDITTDLKFQIIAWIYVFPLSRCTGSPFHLTQQVQRNHG